MPDHTTARLDSRYDAGLWHAQLLINGEQPTDDEIDFILAQVFPNIPPAGELIRWVDPADDHYLVRVPIDVATLVYGGADFGWTEVLDDPIDDTETIVSVFVPTRQESDD